MQVTKLVIDETVCCSDCFADEAIRDLFAKHPTVAIGRCSFCGATNVRLISTEIVGKWVVEGIRRAYTPVELSAEPWHISNAHGKYRDVVTLLEDHGLCSAKTSTAELIDALLPRPDPDDFGEDDLRRQAFVPHSDWEDQEDNSYSGAWRHFKSVVMHERRFFDPVRVEHRWERLEDTRSEILKPVSRLFPDLEVTLPVGTPLYRARVSAGQLSDDAVELQAALGPPPCEKASNSRMNPPGIPYLYLASDESTCIAEVRPEAGQQVWLGMFRTSVALRIVDLTVIPAATLKSIFDPSYDDSRPWVGHFMQEFSNEISKPVSRDDAPLSYIPTQVLAEFIRHCGYHGLCFNSSLTRRGMNYVLFDGPSPGDAVPRASDLRYRFTQWMHLAEAKRKMITSVRYKTESHEHRAFTESEVRVETKRHPF